MELGRPRRVHVVEPLVAPVPRKASPAGSSEPPHQAPADKETAPAADAPSPRARSRE